MITSKEYFMGRDESHKTELTDEIMKNAEKLLSAVNALIAELEYKGSLSVSSGWRPPSVNANVKGAAKKSLHQNGLAIDVAGHELYKLIESKPELLKKHKLWMEDASAASSWTHLDLGTRRDREVQIFKP